MRKYSRSTAGEPVSRLQANRLAAALRRRRTRATEMERRQAQLPIGLEDIEAGVCTVFHASPVGIALGRDFDGRILDANDAWLQVLGYSREDMIGSTISELGLYVHPEQREQIVEMVRRNQEVRDLEVEFRRKSGEVITTLYSAELVHLRQQGYLLVTISDITARKSAEQASQENCRRYRSLYENMLHGLAFCRMEYQDSEPADFIYLDVNPAFERLTGLGDVVGRRVTEIIPGIRRSDPELFEIYGRVATTGKAERFEFYLSAMETWFSISVYSPSQGYFVALFDNVTERKRGEAQLAHLAHHDPLTDLPNRALLNQRLDRAAAHARRTGARGAVLFLDLDQFKVVNDSLGHAAGDQLLQAVALRLQERVRNTDTLARLGGDEFVIVLEDLSIPEDASRVARDLIDQVAKPAVLADGTSVYVGCSIGISVFPDDGEDAGQLIKQADTALFRAKDAGRNTFRFYTSAQTAIATRRLTLEASLRAALENGEFILHYQPLVGLAGLRPIGVEALVRWRKSDGEIVSPAAFIPLAEETGLIVPLGQWVLQEACSRMKAWRDVGLPLQTMAVNLSPRQFRHPDLRKAIRGILDSTGLSPSLLELEITEGAVMESGSEAEHRLAGLKDLGVRLAIDDFGTGYSSLAYLKRFPLDTLKIDQSFVRDIPHDPAGMQITATIVAMARILNLSVLAEGIETPGQLEFLDHHRCDIGQGYLFSRPVPEEELKRWMTDPGLSLPTPMTVAQ